MGRLIISHLALEGDGVPTVSIQLGPKVTIIHGPSDTGKSFIASAINFVLGAQKLKWIPELEGYTDILVGLEFPGKQSITLIRRVSGGQIDLFTGSFETRPAHDPTLTLSPKHKAGASNNLSQYLLQRTGFAGRQVRTNKSGKTTSLSFRDLAKLCIVDETRLQSPEAPATSGNPTTKTREVSVLRMMLSGQDDSDASRDPKEQDHTNTQQIRAELLDELLFLIEKEIGDIGEMENLGEQLAALNQAIETQLEEISELMVKREKLVNARIKTEREREAKERQIAEAEVLYRRFKLLLKKYENDIKRLELVSEAGSLLGYFSQGPCPFCGAAPESQHLAIMCEGDGTAFSAAAQAESAKTQTLIAGLTGTILEIESKVAKFRATLESIREQGAVILDQIGSMDSALAFNNVSLERLLDQRSELERKKTLMEQREALTSRLPSKSDDPGSQEKLIRHTPPRPTAELFSKGLAARLSAWGFPNADSVEYDWEAHDIVAEGQLRSAHGKGVRAILHAAFTIALLETCREIGQPHPGFIILDSPLVTYRSPDSPSYPQGNVPDGLQRQFFKDLQLSVSGQVIILENLRPPYPLEDETVEIAFTKKRGLGRYGFFPSSGR